jgi:hypothetical protein
MNRKWRYFGAAVLAAYLLLTAGAPPLAVAIGIAFGAMLTLRASRSA